MNQSEKSNHAQAWFDRFYRPSILLGLFLILSCWALWPLPLHALVAIPSGDSPVGTVPLLNAWIMWWNSASIFSEISGYWDAPIFYPSQGTLALSEPQPATVLAGPVIGFLGLPAAYNFYLIISLLLNGLVGSRVLKTLGCNTVACGAGGCALVLLPIGLQNLEAMQLVPVWPMLLTIERVHRFLKGPCHRNAFLVSVGVGLTAIVCLHHTLFLLLLIAPALVLSVDWSKPAIQSKYLLIMLITAAVCLLPLVLPLRYWHQHYELVRSPQVVEALSADFVDWVTPQSSALIPLRWFDSADFPLLPGFLRTGIALCAIPILFGRDKSIGKFLTGVLLLGFVLSFGLNLSLFGWKPWETLAAVVPPIGQIRSPYRFAYLVQIVIILLATLGLDHFFRAIRRTSVSWRTGVAAFAFVWLVFAIRPPQTYLYYPPLPEHNEPWVASIREAARPGDALLCLPVSRGPDELSCQRETVWMHYAIQHELPILNGYSGFAPRSWKSLQAKLRDAPLSPAAIGEARAMGATIVAIRKDQVGTTQSQIEQLKQKVATAIVHESSRYLVVRIADQADQG